MAGELLKEVDVGVPLYVEGVGVGISEGGTGNCEMRKPCPFSPVHSLPKLIVLSAMPDALVPIDATER